MEQTLARTSKRGCDTAGEVAQSTLKKALAVAFLGCPREVDRHYRECPSAHPIFCGAK